MCGPYPNFDPSNNKYFPLFTMNKLIGLGVALAATWLMAARVADVLSDTGVTMDNVRQGTLQNLTEERWFQFRSTNAMRQMARRIPESSRATAVRALGKVVRSYCESAEFKKEFLGWVKQKYPYDDRYSDENIASQEQAVGQMDGMVNQQLGMMQQAYAQIDPAMLQQVVRAQLQQQEQELAGLEGDDRTALATEISDVKKMLSATAGKPAAFKTQYLAYQNRKLQKQAAGNIAGEKEKIADAKVQNAEYHSQKAAFDAHSDARPLLKKRLNEFIALCNDVDFGAQTVQKGYRLEFVNPVHQRKPAEWKFLYRLGKEPVMEAKAFAQAWLTDLERVR